MKFKKKIKCKRKVLLYGKTYSEITFEDGEVILKRYDQKSKMWVTLSFSQDQDDEEEIQRQIHRAFQRIILQDSLIKFDETE